MADRVKCYKCGEIVVKSDGINYPSESGTNRWFHPKCYSERLDYENLVAYICSTFKFKAPGQKINSQHRMFIEKYNYTDKGMLNALRYCYEIQKNSINKAKEGIGIIPYVYAEAQEYFNKLEQKQNIIAQKIAENMDAQTITKIVVNPESISKPSEKKLIDITELYKEE